ncbi:MAG TPA: SRPBCC family protein [Chloroflexota bacterium]|nr:SRPBCC family protein [Chloroflexota bacterium]
MYTENAVTIRADLATIYQLAAAVERWPALLPHYRAVRVLAARDDRRLVAMAARRGWIPVRWSAVQVCEPAVPRIRFRHVRGVTRGMAVEWVFESGADGVRVSIRHELRLGWPLVGRLVADRIIGPLFVAYVAGQTLRRIKALAERRQPMAGAVAPRPLGSEAGST